MLGELSEWFKERGYEESFVQQQIGRVRMMDREVPALASMMRMVQKLHPMLKSTDEHRKVFPEPPFIAFRRCRNLKDTFVRSKLYNVENGACDKRGCSLWEV